jgi:hypothetical protein
LAKGEDEIEPIVTTYDKQYFFYDIFYDEEYDVVLGLNSNSTVSCYELKI